MVVKESSKTTTQARVFPATRNTTSISKSYKPQTPLIKPKSEPITRSQTGKLPRAVKNLEDDLLDEILATQTKDVDRPKQRVVVKLAMGNKKTVCVLS
ncbi:unnamed protein product, partial [Didymodactylos carnosus]